MNIRPRPTPLRPRLVIPRSPLEIGLETMGASSVIAVAYLLISNWSRLPERIPTHFGFDGHPNAYGDRTVLLLVPGILVFVYTLLTVLSRYPHVFNYVWPITEENAAIQYRLARTLMTALKAEIACLMVLMLAEQIRMSLGATFSFVPTLLPIGLGVIFGTIGIYFITARKRR